jgi:hypothetical protein
MRDHKTSRKSHRDSASPHRKRKSVTSDESDILDDTASFGSPSNLDDKIASKGIRDILL